MPDEQNQVDRKYCGGCGQNLPTGAFCKDRSREDGLYPRCGGFLRTPSTD